MRSASFIAIALLMLAVTGLNHYTATKNQEMLTEQLENCNRDLGRTRMVAIAQEYASRNLVTLDDTVQALRAEQDRTIELEKRLKAVCTEAIRSQREVASLRQFVKAYDEWLLRCLKSFDEHGIKPPEPPTVFIPPTQPRNAKPDRET